MHGCKLGFVSLVPPEDYSMLLALHACVILQLIIHASRYKKVYVLALLILLLHVVKWAIKLNLSFALYHHMCVYREIPDCVPIKYDATELGKR